MYNNSSNSDRNKLIEDLDIVSNWIIREVFHFDLLNIHWIYKRKGKKFINIIISNYLKYYSQEIISPYAKISVDKINEVNWVLLILCVYNKFMNNLENGINYITNDFIKFDELNTPEIIKLFNETN